MGKNNNDSNLGNMQIFSENFKYYLEKNKELKKDIAKAVGTSAGTICDWINCRTYPRMNKIEKLAEHWGITMADLVEKHDVENAYYRDKYAQTMVEEIVEDPKCMEIYQAIKKISPENREIILALVKALEKEEK